MTMIARVADALPLAASIQEDEQVSKNNSYHGKIIENISFYFEFLFQQLGKNIVDYQNQAKRLFKTLTATSPIKCSIESGPYLFQ